MADLKITQLPADAAPTTDDLLPTADSPGGTPTTKKITIASLIGLIYPVGSIYTSTASTDPATLFGVGTWAAFGAGKVLVGLDSGDTDFDVAEETGGAKTVATNVTVATQPTFTVNSHTHTLSDNGWAQATIAVSGTDRIRIRRITVSPNYTDTHSSTATTTSTSGGNANGTGTALGGATDATAGTATTRSADVALTNNATSVVQPYIVVYLFKRTA